jgi:hypothetical protein
MITWPAADGSQGLTWPRQAAGRAPAKAGSKISTVMRSAVAPAVRRIGAPSPSTGRYDPAAHGSQRARGAEADRDALAGEDRLAAEERRERRRPPGEERYQGEHGCLGGQHHDPPRRGGQRRADRAGRVLR